HSRHGRPARRRYRVGARAIRDEGRRGCKKRFFGEIKVSRMKNGSDKLDKQLSRRKFLEHTTTAGSAAVISSAVARAQNAGGAVSSNSSVPSMGTMIEYKSNDLMIPAYLARPTKQNAA